MEFTDDPVTICLFIRLHKDGCPFALYAPLQFAFLLGQWPHGLERVAA